MTRTSRCDHCSFGRNLHQQQPSQQRGDGIAALQRSAAPAGAVQGCSVALVVQPAAAESAGREGMGMNVGGFGLRICVRLRGKQWEGLGCRGEDLQSFKLAWT